MINWSTFHAAMTGAGLVPLLVDELHWQILGGVKPVDVFVGLNGVSIGICIGGEATRRRIRSVGGIVELLSIVRDGRIPTPSKVEKQPKSNTVLKQRKTLYEKEPVCYWCRAPLASVEDSTLDHVIPRSKGGANHPDNYVLACVTCNSRRSDLAINPDAVVRNTVFAAIASVP